MTNKSRLLLQNHGFSVSMNQYRDKQLILKIAQRLKGLREAKGLSQKRVTLETDIHVGRLEAGKANPTISTLARLCEYFKVTLVEFFEGLDS